MLADGSINQSNESLASSVSSIHDDEEAPPRFVSVEPLTFALEVTHDPPSFVLSTALKEATQQHPPVSPGTATHIFNHVWHDYVLRNKPLSTEEVEDILQENDDLDATVHATAYGLMSTIHRRAAQYSHNLRQSEQRILEQCNIVAQREEEIARLHTRRGGTQAPMGFVPNEGHISCVIPTAGGGLVVPRFIQRRGNGQVEMVAGSDRNDPVYVSELFLAPDYSHIPTNPMGPWFLQLLTRAPAGFNALAEAAHELASWEPYAKIVRYCRWEQERHLLDAEISELTGRVCLLQESIDNCRGRLKAGGVPFLLHNLEGHANLPRHQGFPRRGRRACLAIGGAPI